MVSGGGDRTLRSIGIKGEQEAACFLIEKGYEIVERNFQVRQGEIDIIAWHEKFHHGKTLCFVEVKTRSGESGSAERATNQSKMIKIQKAAQAYCVAQGIDVDTTPIQFEHVSVYTQAGIKKSVCHVYEIPMG